MIADFEIKDRLSVGKEAWDAFVDSCDEAWLWHKYDFQNALEKWPGRKDISFAVIDPNNAGKIASVFPLFLIPSRVRKFVPWGPMDSLTGPAMSDAIGTKQKKKLLAFIRDILIAKAEELRVSEISIALQMMTPSLRGENCPRTNPLLEMGCTNALTQTWIVDLRKGREDVWSRMEGRARTEIRNAEKAGLTIRIADRDGDMDIYYRMHLDTYKRTGADALPKEYFESIWKDFAQNGLVRWYFAELDGAPIASENFGIYKNGAIYWSGAADEKALKLGANSLIQWTAMQWMIDNGVEWYETGEAFPNAVSGKLKGLNDFKKSFGGELYPYYRGRIDVSGRIAKVLSFLKNNK